ncbi:MAG: hypothetical protein LBK61_10035 [Spirochaetaceae bacterium]|nr:hypothetical protein [Spirochaetaceae bacterium]
MAPAGGENPQGFHPIVNHILCEAYPRFLPRISGGPAEYRHAAALRARRVSTAAA